MAHCGSRTGAAWQPETMAGLQARRALGALAAVAALVLVVAGCGGSGGGYGDSSASPSPQRTTPGALASQPPHLEAAPQPSGSPGFPAPTTEAGRRQLLTAVFDDAQDMWAKIFANSGMHYQQAKLTIFTGDVHTGCGEASSDLGPFYCPADHGVYLDTSFFTALQQRFGVQGGLPPAYVVGHEMGHHVQNLVGTLASVQAAQQAAPAQENQLSVRLELQADCYAGVWIHSSYARDLVSDADLNDALHAATVIADDFQQHKATGTVRPDQWTHGSAAQRRQWLATGFTKGDPDSCDTFSAQ
jgi:predicted metalloprotease